MKLVLKSPNEPPCEAGKDLSVVCVSEDSAMARSAFEILKPLELNLGDEGRLILQLWHPEFLIFNELRELAAVEAAGADIIVTIVHGGRELPGMLKLWMKRWLELREDRPGALVAVLASDLNTPDAAQAIRGQLKAAAVRGNLDFFVTRPRTGETKSGDSGRTRRRGPAIRSGEWLISVEPLARPTATVATTLLGMKASRWPVVAERVINATRATRSDSPAKPEDSTNVREDLRRHKPMLFHSVWHGERINLNEVPD